MLMLATQPSLNELYNFIQKVPKYPLSVQRLLKLASDTGASKELVSFYRGFANDQVFDNEKDLAGRTELLEIMRREDMPKEVQVAPEEY